MAEGFIGRWSQRKIQAREGKPPQAEPAREDAASPPPPALDQGQRASATQTQGGADVPAAQAPLPTLEDVKVLTAESDFSRFLTPGVAPEVRNAAMKKLFADPRFNAMDGMDVYVGDYTKPDPLPQAMLRKLASTQFLGFFEDKDAPREVADNPSAQTVAQSETLIDAVPEPNPNADPDLRLQQDDAPPGEEPGRGVE